MNKLDIFNQKQIKKIPDVRPGDTVKIFQKLKEGEKTRVQPFEGLVIARKHGKGISATITVRKISFGVGVERVFPLYSPMIDKVEILRRAKVRRAKLYYIREKAAKEVRKKMKALRKEVIPADTMVGDEPVDETAKDLVAENSKS